MKIDMLEKIDAEVNRIQNHIVKAGKKYGSFQYDGKSYDCYCKEEEEVLLDGTPYYTGNAFCIDEIYLEENVDDADCIADIDFKVQNFYFEKNRCGEVFYLTDDGFLDWRKFDGEYGIGFGKRRIV